MTSTVADPPAHDEPAGLRTVIASSVVGTTVEWYDFFLYSTAAGVVFNRLFFPSGDELLGTLLSFVTFFVGFLARPIGGILFGHLGDRLGRKGTLITTMLVMGVSTAAMGLLPTYAQIGVAAPLLLVALRICQGLAVGGEWAGAVLLAVEYAPPGRRGSHGAWPQVGLALGLGLGTGLFALLAGVLDERAFLGYGWRIAFLISLALVGVGLLIRLRVRETPEFEDLRRRRGAARVPVVELLRDPTTRRNTLLGLLSRWSEGAAFNTWAVFFIAYATSTLRMSRDTVLLSVLVASAVLAVGILVIGRAADRWRPRTLYAVGSALFALSVFPAFAAFQTRDPLLVGLVLIAVLGLVHAVIYAPQGTLYAQLSGVATRYTGMSFVYQVSGIYASGVTPLIVTSLLAVAGGAPWLACGYLVLTGIIGTAATLAIRPRDLSF